MRRASNEVMVLVALLALLVVGIVLDLSPRASTAERQPAPPGARFESYTSYCPPALKNGEAGVQLSASSLGEESTPVGLEPARQTARLLDPDRVVTFSEPNGDVVNVVGYGAPVTASAVTGIQSPVEGLGSAPCSTEAATDWFFADGSSALHYDERLLVYNPFPDEAVVRVTLFTRDGQKDKASLSEIAVPAQSSIGIKLNEAVRLQRLLSVHAAAVRGRVVVWKVLIADPEERPDGIQFTLGATEISTEWYFPEGWVGDLYDERVALLNPGDEESVVTVSLMTGDGTVQPPRLVEVEVPPKTSKVIALNEALSRAQLRELTGVGVVVRSSNEVGIVAERTIWYGGGKLNGVTNELGAPAPGRIWVVGPASTLGETDSLTVLNPDVGPATVTVRLLRVEGRPIEAASLTTIRITAGSRFKIPIAEFTKGRPMVAVVEADRPIVVERTSYSTARGDFASLMGRLVVD